MKSQPIDFTPYKFGLSRHDRDLLMNIVRQFPELRYASQWCKYHIIEGKREVQMKTRAA